MTNWLHTRIVGVGMTVPRDWGKIPKRYRLMLVAAYLRLMGR